MRPPFVDVCTARAGEKQSSITIYRNGPPICTGSFLEDRLVGGARPCMGELALPPGERGKPGSCPSIAHQIVVLKLVNVCPYQLLQRASAKKVNAVPLGLSL